jgi:glycosyltransferase involved in cell wall biosynthesis
MKSPPFSIVAHSHLRWDFVWQRPQQVFSRLARHHAVLFVEEPIYQPGHPQLRLLEAAPNIVRAIPVLPAPHAPEELCEAVLPLLRRALPSRPLVQWFYSPMCAPAMVGKLGESAVVYDCMDELANFRFAPPDLRVREQFLLKHANVVFTGGLGLYEAKSREHPNVHFFGCGVDAQHYGKARAPDTAVPAAVANLPGPVLGYFGVIDERLDYELIGAVADAYSGGSVVMAGPTAKVRPEELPRQPNVHWLGQQAYADLPALVKGFDVCLMPFALNEATRYINPTKTLEYLAAGKPVVSTAIPDVARNFADVVRVAESPEDFIYAIRDLLHAGADPTPGLARANGATWDATVAAMRAHLLDAVRGRRALAAA